MRPVIRRDYAVPHVAMTTLTVDELKYYISIDPMEVLSDGTPARRAYLEHLARVAEDEDAEARCGMESGCSPSEPSA